MTGEELKDAPPLTWLKGPLISLILDIISFMRTAIIRLRLEVRVTEEVKCFN